MSLIEALILGLIQGITEFLPVSSSGHLEIGKALFGNNALPGESLLFTIVVHAATALSTIIVFHKDIWYILKGLTTMKWTWENDYTVKIILSMIPVFFVGIFFEEQIEQLFSGKILLVGIMLIITGILLYLTTRVKQPKGEVTFMKSFWIGLAQAIAVLPGISRSGATISVSLLLGIEREKAARFSFLMVLPPIIGATLLKIMDLGESEAAMEAVAVTPLVIGFIAAFISGILACRLMIRIVKKSKLNYFAAYCVCVGIVAIAASIMA